MQACIYTYTYTQQHMYLPPASHCRPPISKHPRCTQQSRPIAHQPPPAPSTPDHDNPPPTTHHPPHDYIFLLYIFLLDKLYIFLLPCCLSSWPSCQSWHRKPCLGDHTSPRVRPRSCLATHAHPGTIASFVRGRGATKQPWIRYLSPTKLLGNIRDRPTNPNENTNQTRYNLDAIYLTMFSIWRPPSDKTCHGTLHAWAPDTNTCLRTCVKLCIGM